MKTRVERSPTIERELAAARERVAVAAGGNLEASDPEAFERARWRERREPFHRGLQAIEHRLDWGRLRRLRPPRR